jgi:hypothetical protein
MRSVFTPVWALDRTANIHETTPGSAVFPATAERGIVMPFHAGDPTHSRRMPDSQERAAPIGIVNDHPPGERASRVTDGVSHPCGTEHSAS